MRRRPRQISLKECYAVLDLEENADMADVKRAYRRRAFELHPDLNPGNPDASRHFQLLNEAYVALSAALQHEDEMRAKAETRRAAQADAGRGRQTSEAPPDAGAAGSATGEKTKKSRAARQEQTSAKGATDAAGQKTASQTRGGQAQSPGAAGQSAEQTADQNGGAGESAHKGYAEHDVLRDLLNDPFARRVFEDIYSELNRQQRQQPPQKEERPQPDPAHAQEPGPKAPPQEEKKSARPQPGAPVGTALRVSKDKNGGVGGMVKGWLRRQIDEEQSLTLPAANLAPGKRIRLQIRQAFSGELKTVEISLPPDFAVGKPVRLRGLGKRVGPWQGDLYLTLFNE